MELDVSNQGLSTLDEIVFPSSTNSASVVQRLNVSRNRLTSLVATKVRGNLSHVQELLVTHNRLASLEGIEDFVHLSLLDVSSNAVPLEVIDEDMAALLATSHRLRCVRLSSCGVVEFRLPAALRPAFVNLRQIDLGHNHLETLPDVSSCVCLESLILSFNHIANLDDMDLKLPNSIQELALEHNDLIGGLATLTPLTYLADSLQSILVGEGNSSVIAHRVPGWKALLCWLCPHVAIIDHIAVSESERQVAGTLFRYQASNAIAYDLLSLLEDGKDAQLLSYLRDEHRKVVAASGGGVSSQASVMKSSNPANSVDSWQPQQQSQQQRQSRNVVERQAPRGASPSPSQQPAAMSHPSAAHGGGDHSSPADVTLVVGAIQQKLKRLEEVTKSLWRSDMSRRIFAAIIIQSAFRGYRLRRRLPAGMRLRLKAAADRTRRTRRKPWLSEEAIGAITMIGNNNHQQQQQQQVATAPATTTTRNNKAVIETAAAAAASDEISRKVLGMDILLRELWAEFSFVKHTILVQSHRYATTIQRHYRGYRARLEWKKLKRDYASFQAQFLPPVRRIQEVGRRYLARRKIVESLRRDHEIRVLREDISGLQETVRALQRTVQLLLRDRRVATLSAAASAASEGASALS